MRVERELCYGRLGMKRVVLLSLFSLFAVHCGPPPVVDAGVPDAAVVDAGGPDSGADAGTPDAGPPDAGEQDAGIDAGPQDAGTDAGSDAGFDAGVDAGLAGPDLCPIPSGDGGVFRLRAMAANLTSGNFQAYTPGEGIRIMQGTNPDIVMIQEFNYGTSMPADIATMVNLTFDGGFSYNRGMGVGGGAIPNGVISRWPIIAQGEWTDPFVTNRNFVWAQIDLPGENDLWVISVHLLTSSPRARNNEANALLSLIRANIPANSYVLLGGDLNTDTRDASVETCLTTLSAEFVTTGPHPIDQFGNDGTSGNRNKPYDMVLASPCLARLQGPTVLGTTTFDAGAVIDTRGYFPLSDIAPALQSDSAAVNMQHMGVLKDFFIQP